MKASLSSQICRVGTRKGQSTICVVQAIAESMGSLVKQFALLLATDLALSAWVNGYGRELEDQADRVGLRYAFEAGFDISNAPRLWERFRQKHGDESRVVNFLFSMA